MYNIIDLAANLFLSFTVAYALGRQLEPKYGGVMKRAVKYIFGLVLGILLTLALRLSLQAPGTLALPVIATALYVFLCMEGQAARRIYLVAFYGALMLMAYGAAYILVCFAAGASTLGYFFGHGIYHYCLVFLVCLFFFAPVCLLEKLYQAVGRIGGRNAIFLILIPAASALACICLVRVASGAEEPRDGTLELGIAMSVIFFINLCSFYLYIEIGKNYERALDYAAMAQQYKMVEKNISEVGGYYEQARQIFHDFHHSMSVALGYLEAGDCQEASEYLKGILNQKGSRESRILYCDSNPANYILNSAASRCLEEGIRFEAVITTELKGAREMDICVMLGNLLDNAIEASVKEEKKEIFLEIAQEEGKTLFLVKNRISSSVLEENWSLSSTKSEGFHGYGLKAVKGIVNSLDGDIVFYEEKGFFCCEVRVLKESLELKEEERAENGKDG